MTSKPSGPVAEFDLSKYTFVEEMHVAASLDGRPDLLDLKPVEFEHLVRELFKANRGKDPAPRIAAAVWAVAMESGPWWRARRPTISSDSPAEHMSAVSTTLIP